MIDHTSKIADLNERSDLAQRLAVLESAAWLIDILERLNIGL